MRSTLGYEEQNLLAASGSPDQDGGLAHFYSGTSGQISTKTKYVASWILARVQMMTIGGSIPFLRQGQSLLLRLFYRTIVDFSESIAECDVKMVDADN